jgi:hypothetical protein
LPNPTRQLYHVCLEVILENFILVKHLNGAYMLIYLQTIIIYFMFYLVSQKIVANLFHSRIQKSRQHFNDMTELRANQGLVSKGILDLDLYHRYNLGLYHRYIMDLDFF